MKCLIPPADYTSSERFEQERLRIFRRAWQYAGMTLDLASPGDRLSIEIAGELVTVRNAGGELVGEAADGERWNVETCGKLVFVMPRRSGPSLGDFLGVLRPDIERFSDALGEQIDRADWTIAANWKLLIENGADAYHLPFVHATSFDKFEARVHETRWAPPHSGWHGTLPSYTVERRSRSRVFSAFEAVPFKVPGYWHLLIFPNFLIASFEGMNFNVQCVRPVAPGKSRLFNRSFLTRFEGRPPARAVVDALVPEIVSVTHRTLSEDAAICEQNQLGIAEASEPGVLCSDESRIHAFHQAYLAQMAASPERLVSEAGR
jgi:phenylpropionate dioxygenase-like ring-hydroxylating dioxygenase large terminal subunit